MMRKTLGLLILFSCLQARAAFLLELEAEAGLLVPPMAVTTNASASGGMAVWSTLNDSGTASYPFRLPSGATIYVWARVLMPDGGRDSFYARADALAEDVFDAAPGRWSANWQWLRLNGRGGVAQPYEAALAINPRTFPLNQGDHALRFRGRELGTLLDRLVLTDDPGYVPPGAEADPSQLQYAVRLAWEPVTGVDGYLIYGGSALGASFQRIGASGTTNGVATIGADEQLQFYVTATNALGESDPSNVALSPPARPNGIEALDAGPTQTRVNWTHLNPERVTNYRLQQKVGTNNWSLLVQTPQRSYLASTPPGQQYSFRALAGTSNGFSVPSVVASRAIITPAAPGRLTITVIQGP
jgi:hypothetical protein